jgi:apolipoprotein N-acyltransferase
LNATIAQGQVRIVERNGQLFFATDRAEYEDLTRSALNRGGLIIWPEAAIQDWVPTKVASVKEQLSKDGARLPYFGKSYRMISGAFTYDTDSLGSPTYLYNSALGITSDGLVLRPYHKRVLMPFGEYLPFSDWLQPLKAIPFLEPILSQLSGLSAGSQSVVFNFPGSKVPENRGERASEELDLAVYPEFKAAPLICYEDLIPSASAEPVRVGADLLVNLTNDAWFGASVAPKQHHVIAAFRAIETGRILVRASSSGHTAVVDPQGKSLAELPHFTTGIISKRLPLLTGKTIFVWWRLDVWLPVLWRSLGAVFMFGWMYERKRRISGILEKGKYRFCGRFRAS